MCRNMYNIRISRHVTGRAGRIEQNLEGIGKMRSNFGRSFFHTLKNAKYVKIRQDLPTNFLLFWPKDRTVICKSKKVSRKNGL